MFVCLNSNVIHIGKKEERIRIWYVLYFDLNFIFRLLIQRFVKILQKESR